MADTQQPSQTQSDSRLSEPLSTFTPPAECFSELVGTTWKSPLVDKSDELREELEEMVVIDSPGGEPGTVVTMVLRETRDVVVVWALVLRIGVVNVSGMTVEMAVQPSGQTPG